MKTLSCLLILKNYKINKISCKRSLNAINKTINRKYRKKKLIKSLRKITIKKQGLYKRSLRGQNVDRIFLFNNNSVKMFNCFLNNKTKLKTITKIVSNF